jgi:DNA-binding transcriptional MerR regulator
MRDATMLLPADEAARQLGVQPQTLAQWRHKGGGPAYVKFGNRVFYERAVLDAFIADHRF